MLEENEIKTTAAKLFVLMAVAEIYLFVIKDKLKKELKQKCNSALKSIGMFIKPFDDCIKQNSNSVNESEKDVTCIYNIIEAFVQAEERGITYKFMNDFYRICQQNNIKI